MNEVLVYVVNSLAWSLVGFVLGWLLASLRRDVTDIREAIVRDETTDEREHQRIDRASRVLGIIVALLAVVTVVQAYVFQRERAEVIGCQTQYNAAIADATRARAQLANEDRHALNTLLLSIYERRGDERAQLRAYTDWVNTTRRTEVERKQHPLPELPKGDCR